MHQLTAAVAAITLLAGTASAQLGTLSQRYRIAPFNPDFNRYIDISGTVDTSGLTGSGLEYMPIVSHSIAVYMENPLQYLGGGAVRPTADHTQDDPGNLRAEFDDGVFTNNIFMIDGPNDSGVGWQIINDGAVSSVVEIRPGLMLWGYSVIFWDEYTLESSIIEVECEADFNDDGSVNVLDVVDFITNWNAQGPGADFNNSGSIDVLDVVDFISSWNAGCA